MMAHELLSGDTYAAMHLVCLCSFSSHSKGSVGVVSNGIPQTVPLSCRGAGRQHSAEEKGKLHYNVLRELFLEKYQAYYYASSKEWSLNCRLFSPDWLV